MEPLPNDYKDCPNQYMNNHKLCNEMGNPDLSLMESQWNLRQEYFQISLTDAEPLQNKYYHWQKKINPKKQDFDSHSQGSK